MQTESRLTDVPHGIVRRDRLVRVEREREEAAVRALAPLQVRVPADDGLRLLVCVLGTYACAKGRGGRHRRSRELYSYRTVTGHRIVPTRAVER